MTNNPTIMTLRHGQRFDLARPDPALIDFGDIATALSRQCRFNGHGRLFYSVAEHSVLVSQLVIHVASEADQPRLGLLGLLHDAHEAYLGDITRPVQACFAQDNPAFADRRHQISIGLDAVIYAKAGILNPTATEAKIIHRADNAVLEIEQERLFARHCAPHNPVQGLNPPAAAQAFIKQLGKLMNSHQQKERKHVQ